VLSLETMRAIVDVAHEREVPVHLDGARVFNAAAALRVAPSAIAAEVDSVQFCLSKGLSAPVGSVVVGTAEFIERVRDMRRLVGGAMRQSGVIAAAGLVALEQMVDRLPEDHARAKRLAAGLAEIDGVKINPERVQTNILVVKVEGVSSHEDVIGAFARNGLLVSNYGQRGIRFVTHHEIDDADIARALEIVATVSKEMRAAVGTAA
jgi:threonine aldolase